MSRSYPLRWENAATFGIMMTVTALANAIPLGGNTTGQVSAEFPSLITPAPWAFTIWAAIYVFMGLFVLFQMGWLGSRSSAIMVRRHVSYWFSASCLLNAVWIVLWHFRFIGLSVVAILGLLFCLLKVYQRIGYGSDSKVGRICGAGFQLYVGWVSVAAIVNLAAYLTHAGWIGDGFWGVLWMSLVLVAGMLLGVSFAFSANMPFATLAVAWAYAGVLSRHLSAGGFHGAYPLLVAVLAASLMVLLGCLLLRYASNSVPGDVAPDAAA